jgi:hypothetical protein
VAGRGVRLQRELLSVQVTLAVDDNPARLVDHQGAYLVAVGRALDELGQLLSVFAAELVEEKLGLDGGGVGCDVVQLALALVAAVEPDEDEAGERQDDEDHRDRSDDQLSLQALEESGAHATTRR